MPKTARPAGGKPDRAGLDVDLRGGKVEVLILQKSSEGQGDWRNRLHLECRRQDRDDATAVGFGKALDEAQP